MTRKKLFCGIIGSGFSASFHVDSVRRVFGVDVEIAGVYSPNKEHRTQFGKIKNVTVVDSLDELIENADVLHICAPPYAHEPLAIQVLSYNKSVIVEKPFTGYFGDGSESFDGKTFPREIGLERAMESVKKMIDAERKSKGRIFYSENWVYAPAIQKEKEIIEKTDAQIIWIHGEESHSGSHSRYYGIWSYSGGGSMIGKGVHPLTAALYLKKVEGRMRTGKSIRPRTVSARVHSVTRSEKFINREHIRTEYKDTEDFAFLHVVFEDDTFADIFASELVLGGVHNWIEVNANNHRGICNINPNTSFLTYNPREQYFQDIYVVEKTETKQGWAFTSPDEDWFTGYYQEMEAFYRSAAYNIPVESDSILAADAIAVIYSGYLSAFRKGAEVQIPLVQGG